MIKRVLAILAVGWPVFAANPIVSYVQLSPPNGTQAGGFNTTSGTVTSSLTLPFLTGTQCLQVVNGAVSGTGSACGSGGGGGGTTGTVSVSSQYSIPYYLIPGSSNTIIGLAPGTSGYVLASAGPSTPPFWKSAASSTGLGTSQVVYTAAGGTLTGSQNYQFNGTSLTVNGQQLVNYSNPGYLPGADPTTTPTAAVLLNGTNFAGTFAVNGFGFSNSAAANAAASALIGYTGTNTSGAEGNGLIFLNSAGTQIANLGVNGTVNGFHIGTGVGQNKLDVAGGAVIGSNFTRSALSFGGNVIGAPAPANGLAVQGNVAIGTYTATNTQVFVQISTANKYGIVLGTTTAGGNRVWISSSLEFVFNGSTGTAGQVLTSGGPGVPPSWQTGSGGGGTPGGSNTQVQYNSAGSFAGSVGLTWNGTSLTAQSYAAQSASGFIQNINGGIGITSPVDINIVAQSSSSVILGVGTGLRFVANSGIGNVTLRSPNTTFGGGSQLTFVLPSSSGTAGQFVQTDGNGNLAFATATPILPLPGGDTSYVQISNTLQAGSTFYVSSGTVLNLAASTITVNGPLGLPGIIDFAENTSTTGIGGFDRLYGDSSSHLLKLSNNAGNVGSVISSTVTASANKCAQFSADGYLVPTSAACGTGSGGGTPSGGNYNVQVSSAGAFGSSNNFQYDGSTLTVAQVARVDYTNVSTFSVANAYVDFTQSTMTVSSATVTGQLRANALVLNGGGGAGTVTFPNLSQNANSSIQNQANSGQAQLTFSATNGTGFNTAPVVGVDITAPIVSFTSATIGATGLNFVGKVNRYNAISTVGYGVPAIYGTGRSTAQTAAIASLAAYTVGAADGSFEISPNVNVTASATHSFTMTCTYTDETNTSRTFTLGFSQLGGTIVNAITNVTGVGPYEGIVQRIRAKAGTAITIATTGTFTSVTYNAEVDITEKN